MFDFSSIFDYILLISAFFFAVLSPGFVAIELLFPRRYLNRVLSKILSKSNAWIVQKYFYYLFSPATGLVVLDGMVFILNRLNIKLSRPNLFATFFLANIVLWGIKIGLKKNKKKKINQSEPVKLKSHLVYIFIALWIFAIAIRTVFYLPDAVPQNTDLGHHMYWAEFLVSQEKIPQYTTSEVIVGEHLIFGSLSKLAGISLLSSLALIILSFYNLILILSLPILALIATNKKKIAIFALFLSGVYYAIDAPQAKFVKGGVIGNTFGNLFFVLCFILISLFFRYFLVIYKNKIIPQKKSDFKALSLFVTAAIFFLGGALYTHHLSAFLLIICFLFTFLYWAITIFTLSFKSKGSWGSIKEVFLWFSRVILKSSPILAITVVAFFIFIIYTPFYLQDQAVNTVLRAPLKETHLGFSFLTAPGKIGYFRLLFFTAGIISLFILIKKVFERNFENVVAPNENQLKINVLLAVLVGWFLPLFILTFTPQISHVDLPSQRIINYLLLPVIIIAAYGADFLLGKFKINFKNKKILALWALIFLIIVFDGTADFRSYFSWSNKFQDTVQLYEASQYLNKNSKQDDLILKDHVSLVGDAWIKFFVPRGYDYFISRTYDYKYAVYDPYNQVDRCPKDIFDVPESSLATACYGQKDINYVILRPKGADFFFWRAKDYDTIYASDAVFIFKKENGK